jgi:hypothetical protein
MRAAMVGRQRAFRMNGQQTIKSFNYSTIIVFYIRLMTIATDNKPAPKPAVFLTDALLEEEGVLAEAEKVAAGEAVACALTPPVTAP